MRYLRNPFKLLLPLVLALLVNATPGKSQNLLAFSPNQLSGWNDTVYIDSIGPNIVTCAGYLKNMSPSNTFSDSLLIAGYIDTGLVVPFSYPLYYLYPTFSIAPNDSAPLLVQFDVSTPPSGGQFHVGNNVVVVWPIGVGPGNWNPGDSIVMNVFIIDTISSVGQEPPGGFLRIYPVPANGPLMISSFHPQYHITHLIIRDASGREVYNAAPTGGSIDTETWAPGLYTIEAAVSNGTVSWYKIMRQ